MDSMHIFAFVEVLNGRTDAGAGTHDARRQRHMARRSWRSIKVAERQRGDSRAKSDRNRTSNQGLVASRLEQSDLR
jgi:hypothetical protein